MSLGAVGAATYIAPVSCAIHKDTPLRRRVEGTDAPNSRAREFVGTWALCARSPPRCERCNTLEVLLRHPTGPSCGSGVARAVAESVSRTVWIAG